MREAARLLLAEDELTPDLDLEHASAALYELDRGLFAKRCLQFGDQTGRLREVVSAHAVGDADVHGSSLVGGNTIVPHPTKGSSLGG